MSFIDKRIYIFKRKENIIEVPALVNRQRVNITKNLRNNFGLLNTFFWLHFVGFNDGFQCSNINNFGIIISVVLAIITESISFFHIFIQLQENYALNKIIGKNYIVLGVSFLLEFCLRMVVYFRRNKFNIINKKLVKIYCLITERSMPNLKGRLLLILFLNDFCNVSVHIYYVIVRIYFFPRAVTIYYVGAFLFNYNMMTVIIPIYFCWYCFILNEVLGEMKIKLRTHNINIHVFYRMYDAISDLILFINETFQTLMLLTFGVLLGWIFNDFYQTIFITQISPFGVAVLYSYSITRFTRLFLVCSYSSLVMKSSTEFKNTLFKLPCDLTPLVLHVESKISVFTLLNTIVIDKRLLVTFIGSFLTYGMLIANFRADNENEGTN